MSKRMKSIGIILIVILLFPSPAYSQEWASFESEHYIFYYIEGYFSRQELKNIADTQEDIFDFVTDFLKTEYNERIEYYLHPSREEFASFAGGYACRSGEVHWLCKKCGVEYCKQWKGDPHEITHILSFEIGVPSLLFEEGLAVYVANMYFGRESHLYSKFLLENDSIVLPRDLLSTFGDNDPILSYSEAGSFVAFMIESYGIEEFLEFYSESPEDLESVEMNMKSIYRKSFGDLENEWISFLQKYELDVPEIRDYRETIEKSGEIYSDYMEFARIPGHYSEDIECDFSYFWRNSVENFEKATYSKRERTMKSLLNLRL